VKPANLEIPDINIIYWNASRCRKHQFLQSHIQVGGLIFKSFPNMTTTVQGQDNDIYIHIFLNFLICDGNTFFFMKNCSLMNKNKLIRVNGIPK